MPLPAPIATDPWLPARKRVVLELPLSEAAEAFVPDPSWADPGAAYGRFEDVYDAVPVQERERRILDAFEARQVVPVYAARHLGNDALRRAALEMPPQIVAHYRFVEVFLARLGGVDWDLLTRVYPLMPHRMFEILMALGSPRVARFLAEQLFEADRSSASAARDRLFTWTARHPRAAMSALLPWALGSDAKRRASVTKLLKELERRGHRDAIEAVAAQLGEDALVEARVLLAPPPLPPKAPKLPTWLALESSTKPRLEDGTVIEGAALERLVQLCALLPLEAAKHALDEVIAVGDRASMDSFAWSLAESWLAAGGDAKGKWALYAAGALGDDTVARRLAESARSWAEAGQHARAAIAVEAIAGIGTDVALLHLDALSRVKKGALKKRAATALFDLREARGLSEAELQDRLVPDLGLDADGSRVLDYGARRFRVGFDERLSPFVLDESGRRLARLPKPAASDDAEAVERATQLYKDLRAETKTIGAQLAQRLERAMTTSRRWSRADWERFFMSHPLTIHFTQRLVWGIYDEHGARVSSFRVAEDRSLADIADDALELSEGARAFGIAHPMELGADETNRWADVFADYELLQPFLQLGRSVRTPTSEERAASRTGRFAGATVPGNRFFTLKHRGWEFPDYDIGKRLEGGIIAFLATEPGLEFLGARPEDQTLGELYLQDASGAPRTFGELGPIAVSELFFDVEALR